MGQEEALKQMMLNKYGTVKDFSRVCGIPYTTVVGVLNRGISNANAKTLRAIAATLNLHVDQLLHGTVAPITSAVEDFADIAPPTPANLAAKAELEKAKAAQQPDGNLTTEEARVIKLFRKLDDKGKQKVFNFIIDLLE